MEKREREPIGQFVKQTDFMAKLRAVLEDVEQGQGFGVFEGLQVRGNCAVSLSFDGVSVRLAAIDENKFPDKMPMRPPTAGKIRSVEIRIVKNVLPRIAMIY